MCEEKAKLDELQEYLKSVQRQLDMHGAVINEDEVPGLIRLADELANELVALEEEVFHPSEPEHAGHGDRSRARIRRVMERAGIK